MRKQVAWLLILFTLGIMLSGCGGGNGTAIPDTAAGAPMQSEPSSDITPVSEAPAAVNEQEPLEPEDDLTIFESDYGYSISYKEDSFDYRRTEGYDEFILQSDAAEKPFVFACISYIDAEFVEAVASASLGDSAESCTIGQTGAQCSETEEAWDGGKIIRKNYIYPLASGNALLIETQWYTEQEENPYAAWLWEMVSSITA